jgi:hypothetical protein
MDGSSVAIHRWYVASMRLAKASVFGVVLLACASGRESAPPPAIVAATPAASAAAQGAPNEDAGPPSLDLSAATPDSALAVVQSDVIPAMAPKVRIDSGPRPVEQPGITPARLPAASSATPESGREVAIRGDVTIGRPLSSKPVLNADRALAKIRPGLVRCFETSLKGDPSLKGTLTARILVGKEGEVTSADLSPSAMPAAMTACLVAALKRTNFEMPSEGATIGVPLTFSMAEQQAPQR